MPTLPQTNPRLTMRIRELFPVTQEHWDLLVEFRKWRQGEMHLSADQIEKTLAGIRQDAIPRTQRYLALQTLAPQREEAEVMLHDWEDLERLLSAAIE